MHQHAHGHSHDHSTKNLKLAFVLNTLFALIEIAGGLLTNSVAILSDAVHDLGDSLSLGLSWYFHKKSSRRGDEKFSYGYQRFSLVGALISSIVLIVGSAIVLAEAIGRLREPAQPDARGMLLLAVLGFGVNLIAMLRLRKGKSITEETVGLHFLEDVLGWLAVLVSAVVMLFVDVPILDPLLSLLISVYILSNVYRNMKKVFRILLQGVPAHVSEETVQGSLRDIEQLLALHHIHIWTMDGNYNVITLHANVSEGMSEAEKEDLKKEIRARLGALNIQHVTIELETGEQKSPRC